MKKQVHVYYSGTVQGVGFRYTVEEIANRLNITGWIKNLPGGRVEAVAEADEEDLKEFLSGINNYFSRYIKGADIKWLPAEGKFSGFKIRF